MADRGDVGGESYAKLALVLDESVCNSNSCHDSLIHQAPYCST